MKYKKKRRKKTTCIAIADSINRIGTNGKPWEALKLLNAIAKLMIGNTLATYGEEITKATIGNNVLAIYW